MSHILINQLQNFKSFKVDKAKKMIKNLNSAEDINLNDFLEISHLLDNTLMNYKTDSNLNIIVLGKK